MCLHVWVFFMVNLWKRYGQTLRRIILLHLGLVTFRFAFGRNRTRVISLIQDFWTFPWLPKPTVSIFGDPGYLKEFENIPKQFENILVWKSQNVVHRYFWTCLKNGRREIPTIHLVKYWESCIWNQNLPENMKWAFGNMEPISFKKTWNRFCELLKLWNQGTLIPRKQKPRIQETAQPMTQETRSQETKN